MSLRALIAVLVLAVASGPALAADIIGYGEAFNMLFRVDLTTQTAQQVGLAGYLNGQLISNIEGLTYSPNGTLYAVSDALKVFLQINPTTGAATVIGPLNLPGENNISQQLDLGMAFTCDGRLWLSAGDGNFWQVNPATGATTLVGNLGVKVTGLAASGNQVYGAGSQGNNNLYQINPANAQATLIGAYGANASYITTASPGFDATGRLWAILDYVPPPSGNSVAEWSDLATISSTAGTLSDLGPIMATGLSASNLEYIGLKGLAIAPTACSVSPPVSVDSTPALSWRGMVVLIALLMLFTGTRLRPRRPNA